MGIKDNGFQKEHANYITSTSTRLVRRITESRKRARFASR